MDISAVSMLAVPSPTGYAPSISTMEGARREFDALVLRTLLEGGALPTAELNESPEWSLLGGTLTELLASELAAQIDLGFGQMLAVGAR